MQRLVYLIWGSFKGIIPFTGFFLFWVIVFTLMTQLTQIDTPGVPDDGFPAVLFLDHLMYSISNSVGDLNYPAFTNKWNTDKGYNSPPMIALIFI